MSTKMTTFQIDLKGKIRKCEEKTPVTLDPFWVQRIEGGAELAVIQTPVIPTDEELQNELLVATTQSEVVSEIVNEVAGLRESHFDWTPDPENRIDAYLVGLFSFNGKMLIKDRVALIQKAIAASPKIRRNISRTIEKFSWDGKRYACHLKTIDDTHHIAEVDMGIPMLQIDVNGKLTQQMDPARPDRPARGPLVTRTLLGRLFPGIHIAQVTVPVHMSQEQKTIVRNALYSVVYKGLRYKPTLATGGLKNGQIILIEEKYAKAVAKMYHQIPQAALGYGGIVVNECTKALAPFVATVKVVKEGEYGTNDSRGWMDKTCFDELKTLDPGHFYQFRMAFLATEETLIKDQSKYEPSSLKLLNDSPVPTKGCFKVMDVATASHPEIKANFIIPDSCLKPARKDLIGKTFRCVVHVGITEQSYDGVTFGSQTVATHVPWDLLSTEVYEDSLRMMEELAPGFSSEGHGELLQKIGAVNKSDTDLMRVMEACLAADGNGGMMRHPYVHGNAKKLLAKWLRKLLSGGIELNTRALADDGFCFVDSNGVLHCGSDWMPKRAALTDYEGKRSICIRFPVRMREDLLPVRHMNRKVSSRLLRMKFPTMPEEAIQHVIEHQLYLQNVHVLNGGYAKVFGGDFDFDLVYILSGVRYKKLVDWRFDYIKDEVTQPTKNKKKRESLWHQLGEICFDAMSNKVGRITNDIMSAIAVGKMELVYTLAIELQEEVSGLKHDTSANMEIVEDCERQIGTPARWIEMLAKEDIRSFDDLPEKIEPLGDGDVIARYYNKLYEKAKELIGDPRPLSEYSGLFNGLYGVRAIAKQDYREAYLLNSFYSVKSNEAIRYSTKKRNVLQAAKAEQKALRAKIKDAEAKAKTDEQKQAILDLKKQNRELNEKILLLTADYEKAQIETKKGLSFFRNVVCAWGRGKSEEEKMYWAAVLNDVITKKASYDNKNEGGKDGKDQNKRGTGSTLIHAFPQQFVDAIAAATEGKAVAVDIWQQDWSVRLDAEKLSILKVETAEDGQVKETLLYQGYPVTKTLPNGRSITTTDWKRRVDLDFLGEALDDEEVPVEAA